MPKKIKKTVRCPFYNRNHWIRLEVENDVKGESHLLCMTCSLRDQLHRQNKDCGTECRIYFYSD